MRDQYDLSKGIRGKFYRPDIGAACVDYDQDKVDEMTMALMYLVIHQQNEFGARAWKGYDWDTLNRLHEKGLISDPVSKAKSVVLSPEAVEQARELFEKHFATPAT